MPFVEICIINDDILAEKVYSMKDIMVSNLPVNQGLLRTNGNKNSIDYCFGGGLDSGQ